MKKNILKRLTALGLAAVMVVGSLTACGGSGNSGQTTGGNGSTQVPETKAPETAPAGDAQTDATTGDAETTAASDNGNGGGAATAGGTIMWLSNLSSGPQYEANMAYAQMICTELGYDWKVVYGDGFNDPAGNLSAVKNAMTNDVVAIIASQDGGIQNIMEEYPDLYVCGYNTDMASVYSEGGASAACATNEKFLGTIVDGYADGTYAGQDYARAVIDGGYKKVATIGFPAYAYPQIAVQDATFRAEIAKYNETAADEDKIEIVGESKILEFAPLDESWFMEADNSELDAIVAMCAGILFVYPTMKSAMGNGLCSANTKLITGGFENSADIVADIGGDGVIQYISISPLENIAWPIVMIDNALQGKMYADYTKSEQIDSARFTIDSKEDMDNVMTKTMCGDYDPAKAMLTMDDLKTVLTRYTPDATYAQLNELFHSDKLSVDSLK